MAGNIEFANIPSRRLYIYASYWAMWWRNPSDWAKNICNAEKNVALLNCQTVAQLSHKEGGGVNVGNLNNAQLVQL